MCKLEDFARGRSGGCTSEAMTLNASHSIRGSKLRREIGLYSISDTSSSASRKWRGKLVGEVLHDLTAHVRKLAVRIFMTIGMNYG